MARGVFVPQILGKIEHLVEHLEEHSEEHLVEQLVEHLEEHMVEHLADIGVSWMTIIGESGQRTMPPREETTREVPLRIRGESGQRQIHGEEILFLGKEAGRT